MSKYYKMALQHKIKYLALFLSFCCPKKTYFFLKNLQYTSFGPHLGSSRRLLDNATHMTKIPTATTITVAISGTIKLRSNHSGIQFANNVLPFAKLFILFNGGANVPMYQTRAEKKTQIRNGFMYLCDDCLCYEGRKSQ